VIRRPDARGFGRAVARAAQSDLADLARIYAVLARFAAWGMMAPEDDRSAIERVAAQLAELDILVNNAGAIPPGNLLAVDNETWRAAWDLKVFGYFNLTRARATRA
jgi:NAD(P)-dependent dehydrogenase (short-subunit alcohol dehydrogenase family)